ncbi:hypothetical protein DTO027I6_10243 [Penicillium roqueforti]|nr:hypothetical protein CBS147337_10224 [Penicillium roqueforti]KAI3181166.1 hypothetical protein DTO027I6_10243 [Penicillium roqueforti]
MLQTRNLQIKEQFYHHLLTGFPYRPILHSNGPSIASRRASKLAFRASFNGNPQKLRLDLSNITTPFSHGSAALASATTIADIDVTSSNTPFDPYTQSCIACTSSLENPFTMLSPPSAINSGHMCSYTMQQTSAPAWNTAATHHQKTPASDQTLTDTRSGQIWQQQMMRKAEVLVDTAIRLPQSRRCLASAQKSSLQHPAPSHYDLSGSISCCKTDCHNHGRAWCQCQPGNNFHTAQLVQVPPTTTVSSPKTKVISAETELTSGFAPTRNTSLPLTAFSTAQATLMVGDEITVNDGDLHLDSNQLSLFGLGLGKSPLPGSD